MTQKNTRAYYISDEVHVWAEREANRRERQIGGRWSTSMIVEQALRQYREGMNGDAFHNNHKANVATK